MGEGSFCLVSVRPSASAGVGFSGSDLGPAQHQYLTSKPKTWMHADGGSWLMGTLRWKIAGGLGIKWREGGSPGLLISWTVSPPNVLATVQMHMTRHHGFCNLLTDMVRDTSQRDKESQGQKRACRCLYQMRDTSQRDKNISGSERAYRCPYQRSGRCASARPGRCQTEEPSAPPTL